MYSGAVKRVSLQDIKLVTVSLEMEDNDPNKECLYARGLSEFISWINADKKPLHDVLGFRKEINGTTVDIALQWCVDGYSAKMLGYANSIRTMDGGTHIDGVKASITRTFNSLVKKSKLVEDKDIILREEHVIEGLTCIVSVIVPRPEFEGQTQTRLGNPYVREIVDQSVQEYLTEYFELHPDVFESIISKSFNAKTALAVKRARDLYRSESVATLCTIRPIPEKLTNCSSETSEIFIGRGDSSGGAANHGSDRCFKSSWDSSRECQKNMGRKRKLVTPYEHANAKESSLYQPKGIVSVALTGISVSCQNKRTREQPWRDDAVSTAPGDSSENSSDSNFEKKSKKPMSSVQSSHLCFSSRQSAGDSNPPNPKDVSRKTPKDVTHGSNKTRPVIPIGPGFQAEIPVWIAPTKKGKFYGSPGDSNTLRWLGTGVWPTYSLKKTVHYKKVGEGRSDFCSCTYPRSINCIKRHTKEARELLEKEINHAFYTWKFDEMGEEAGSKSWTAKEKQRFEALVKKNPLSSSDGFWEFASNSFPRKSEKDLLSYYYNVFLIKRMRLLANSSAANHIDSDDDHYDDFLAG